MVYDLLDHIEDLRELCIKTIELLDDLKEKGEISEEEYQKHTYIKKKFLNDTLLR
jgi:hypothetical protein